MPPGDLAGYVFEGSIRSPPEGDAAAEDAAARRVGGAARLRLDELGQLAVVDALPVEAEAVDVDRDVAREAELEAEAAVAAEVRVVRAEVAVLLPREERRAEVGLHLGVGVVHAADQVE